MFCNNLFVLRAISTVIEIICKIFSAKYFLMLEVTKNDIDLKMIEKLVKHFFFVILCSQILSTNFGN